MCARYHSVLEAARLKQFFKSHIAHDIADLKADVFPGYSAPFIRRPPERESGDDAVPQREALVGLFGGFSEHTGIVLMCFNGATAETLYRVATYCRNCPSPVGSRTWDCHWFAAEAGC